MDKRGGGDMRTAAFFRDGSRQVGRRGKRGKRGKRRANAPDASRSGDGPADALVRERVNETTSQEVAPAAEPVSTGEALREHATEGEAIVSARAASSS